MFSSFSLIRRGLTYFWRTNAAVVFGISVAVAVLAGALVVGDSVRESLRELFLGRLGRADYVVNSANFFREQLAEDVRGDAAFAAEGFDAACPLVVLSGALAREDGAGRAAGVQVYGVDERFWRFHGREGEAARAPREGEALLSPALATELGAKPGDSLLLRVEKPSDIPVESLHGRKEDVGRTVRLSARETLDAGALGEFSLRQQQSAVRAVFVSLASLQKNLEREGKANALLVSSREGARESAKAGALEAILKRRFTLEDTGLRLRPLDAARGLALESDAGLLGDASAEAALEAARAANMKPAPVFSYLANAIRVGGKETPYSLVTAFGPETFERLLRLASSPDAAASSVETSDALPPVILNEWAAEDLGARAGDEVTLEYYVWHESGRLETRSARFRLAGVVPLEGEAADRDLVPEYPGITEAKSLADWNPPFPVELSRIRPRDEAYWDERRTTPKAFVTLETGRRLWQSRFGGLTSLRVLPPEGTPPEAALEAYGRSLRAALDPARAGLFVYPARAEGLAASQGATDFGEYFLYFSFFLVASALMLAALFFRLGVEQRVREIGVLRAVGFDAARVRRLFLAEAALLAVLGSLVGLLGAYAYGRLLMAGLRTWWVGAVGTTALTLHASPTPFVVGALGGVIAALGCIVLTLRGLSRASARGLLTGSVDEARRSAVKRTTTNAETTDDAETADESAARRRVSSLLSPARVGVAAAAGGVLLLVASLAGLVGQAAGFFGGGTLLLVSLLAFQSAWLRRETAGRIAGNGWLSVSRLGARNAAHRPGRSVLCITLIASAAFIIVAVDAFRRDAARPSLERKSGTGGYTLMAESLLPVVHDPNTDEGREALLLTSGEPELDGLSFARFRLRPGDDTSCLNLYRPRQPRLLAPTDDFLREGRFNFQSSLASSDEEKANPWLLLRRDAGEGVVPVIADANSMTYVLHLKLGEDFLLERGGASPVRLRLVAALADSVFQGELLMSEQNFLRLFPEQEGHRFFLLDVPQPERAREVAAVLEERLSDFGLDAVTTAERLDSFHRVENTFLSTFQMLGGLGLALGTLGLAAVLLRNVLERRRELALLRAVGYNRAHLGLMVVSENALLLACGLLTGVLSALLAIAPVVAERGGRLPVVSLGALLAAVVVSGLAASLVATAAALRSPLLASLRAE